MFVKHPEVEYNCSVSVKMLSMLRTGLSLGGKNRVFFSFVCLFYFLFLNISQVKENVKEISFVPDLL